MTNIRNKQILFIGILLITFVTAAILLPQQGYAVSTTGNVTADSDAKTAKKGDEVRIQVSTKKMSVSTFIASVEYDPEILTYEGFKGTAGKDDVYLTEAVDKKVHFDVTVEHSETAPVIGMYAVGTADKKYLAAKPLITLLFTAKKDGKVYYRLNESTAGKDGYTSPDVTDRLEAGRTAARTPENAGEAADAENADEADKADTYGVDAETTAEAHSAGNHAALIILLIAIAAFVSGAVIVILRSVCSQ